jgi:hypothetical protein
MSEKRVYGKKTVKPTQLDEEKPSLLLWLLMGFTVYFFCSGLHFKKPFSTEIL